jgi:DNA recombination protein RmuC
MWNTLALAPTFFFTVLTSGLVLAMLRRSREAQAEAADAVSRRVQESSQASFMDLASRVSQSSLEVRSALNERLSERFMAIGKELREELHRTTQGLEVKFESLEQKVGLRLETIGREVQEKLDKNIQSGFAHFQKVQETLVAAEKQLANLNQVGASIQDLNNVLNLPHLRGKIIGEGNLERLLADFLPAGFYASQYPIEGNLVDFVIRFPHLDLVLPIDSKFSLEQVSALFEKSSQPDELKLARKRLAEITKQNAKEIKNKYIKPKAGTVDYALMYLPSETLYFEVIRDTELWKSLADMKVFPVSPNTLAITINSIGKALHYYEMAKSVQKTIQQIQLAKDHLLDFKKRFDDIGEKLTKAQDSYQKANTHFSNYSSSVQRLSGETAAQVMLTAPNPTPDVVDGEKNRYTSKPVV